MTPRLPRRIIENTKGVTTPFIVSSQVSHPPAVSQKTNRLRRASHRHHNDAAFASAQPHDRLLPRSPRPPPPPPPPDPSRRRPSLRHRHLPRRLRRRPVSAAPAGPIPLPAPPPAAPPLRLPGLRPLLHLWRRHPPPPPRLRRILRPVHHLLPDPEHHPRRPGRLPPGAPPRQLLPQGVCLPGAGPAEVHLPELLRRRRLAPGDACHAGPVPQREELYGHVGAGQLLRPGLVPLRGGGDGDGAAAVAVLVGRRGRHKLDVGRPELRVVPETRRAVRLHGRERDGGWLRQCPENW